jgi:hypothetical protein
VQRRSSDARRRQRLRQRFSEIEIEAEVEGEDMLHCGCGRELCARPTHRP